MRIKIQITCKSSGCLALPLSRALLDQRSAQWILLWPLLCLLAAGQEPLPREAMFWTHPPAHRGIFGPRPTYDIEHAEGTGPVLMEPGVHTRPVEFMQAGDDP